MIMIMIMIMISSALRTKLVYTRFNYNCRLRFSISLSIIPLQIYLLVDVKIVINMPSCMFSDYHWLSLTIIDYHHFFKTIPYSTQSINLLINQSIITSSLKQEYAITAVRYDTLRLYGMAKAGCWEEIRQLYNQRKNIIPIEVWLIDWSISLFIKIIISSLVLLIGRISSKGL